MENSTEGEYSYEFCNYENMTKFGSTVIPIFLTIVVLLSLIGNVLVLVVLGLYENLKSLSNLFLLNLAVSNLIFTLGLPFWACFYIWSWMFVDFLCKAVNFVFSVGFNSSVGFLMLMSIQRYVAVVHPQSVWNRRQRFVVPILAWVFSFAAALPELLFSNIIYSHRFDQIYCGFNNFKAVFAVTYQRNTLFVVAFSVMSFCYIRILQTINRSITNNRNRTIILIFCIVLVFFVSWAPYNIVTLLQSFSFHETIDIIDCDRSFKLKYELYVSTLLAYSHCCLNPVLYVFVGVKFRTHLRTLLQKMLECCINKDSH